MKALFLLFSLSSITIFSVELAPIAEIKKAFETKIIWSDNAVKISINRATAELEPDLTTFYIPISKKEEFDNFFLTRSVRDLEILSIINAAIKAKKCVKIKNYGKPIMQSWPESIQRIADEYTNNK